jgi:hypothetical protein
MIRKLYVLSLIIFSPLSLLAVNISGTVQYERIHASHVGSSSFLDLQNISQEFAKQVLVEAIDKEGKTLRSTFTDDRGEYLFANLTSNTHVKIRVSAKMFKKSTWDVKVIDNTNRDSLYTIEGNLQTTGVNDSIRNLLASASSKNSPPFSILDSIHQAMNKVLVVDTEVNFPPLKVNWSVNNIETGTYYDGTDNIVLQGDQQGDSDEYDRHIVIHEWGHFFEQKLSRADNIGGQHGDSDHLDIRVAFGEGFGNALSAIVTDDPLYFDTLGGRNGWNMNIEEASHRTPGWFSEASIQRILYDLYDSNNDTGDRLSLGFEPLYQVLTQGQKKTPAFTSLFSFIDELKKEYPSSTDKIDAIVANENIATIEDSYGLNRLSNLENDDLPLYSELTVGTTLSNICTTTNYGLYNKLSNHKYISFSIKENNTYPIQVEQSNGNNADPEFTLFKTSPFETVSMNKSGTKGVEEANLALTKGEYLLDISDASGRRNRVCYNISVGKTLTNTDPNTNSTPDNTNTIGISLPENKFLAFIMMLLILFVPLFFIKKELNP